MKEKYFNNLIFIFLIILVLIFSLKCFLISFGIVRLENLYKMINENLPLFYTSLIHQIALASVGFFLFILALYLIWLKQNIAQEADSVKINTDFGEIKISVNSLEQIMLNILDDVEGVRSIEPKIMLKKDGEIKTILKLVIDKDCKIPETARFMQEKLSEELPKISGIMTGEIKIDIDKIAYDNIKEIQK